MPTASSQEEKAEGHRPQPLFPYKPFPIDAVLFFGGLGILFILLVVGALLEPSQQRQEHEEKLASVSADGASRSISYIKDHRVGICYASYAFDSNPDGSPKFHASSTVPCDAVAKLLVNPDPQTSP